MEANNHKRLEIVSMVSGESEPEWAVPTASEPHPVTSDNQIEWTYVCQWMEIEVGNPSEH